MQKKKKKKNAEKFKQTIIAKNNSTVKFPTSKATPTTIDDIF